MKRYFFYFGFPIATVTLLAAAACSSGGTMVTGGGTDSGTKSDGATNSDGGGPVTGKADGTVATWQTLTAMTTPRANHCSVALNGYLVVMGGNYSTGGSFQSTANVDVAKINGDGTIGAWTTAGTLPSGVIECTAAVHGSDILVVDGIYDTQTNSGQVFKATLGTDGSVGAFTSIGSLPAYASAFFSTAWTQNDELYTMYSETYPDAGLAGNSMLATSLSTGSVGSWIATAPVSGFLGNPLYAYSTANVYTLGGYTSDPDGGALDPQSVVVSQPIGTANTLGTPVTDTALPSVLVDGRAFVVDNYLFVFGGKTDVFAGSGLTGVYSTTVQNDGTIGTWASQKAMPAGRTNFAAALYGNYVYVTGGGLDAGGLATVFSAQVRY